MNQLELNIDEASNKFLLIGELESIEKNRRAKYYFRDILKAEFKSENTLEIPYEEETEREKILNNLISALEKYGIDHQDSDDIKQVLESYYLEKENFEIFSEKARGIWHNDINLSEFESFKEEVKKELRNRTLYPKQFLAAYHLAFSQNACNFSVPGAGKTSVVYGAYSYLRSLPKSNPKSVNKILIIGPLSSFGPWEMEYEECFGEKASSKRLSGGVSPEEREDYLLSIDKSAEITLMSYQSVSFNLHTLIRFLKQEENRVMLVLDEAHKIKNTDGGIWADAVLELAKFAASRVVLTGTPVPNGYEDIYNLYQFIWPDKEIINYNVYQLKDMSTNRFDSRVDGLIQNISPFFIRIKKSDLGLPQPKNHPPIRVPMGKTQREIYRYLENRYIGYFQENENLSEATSELTKARFIRLMQAATNPNLLKQPLENYFIENGLDNKLFLNDKELIGKILNYNELEPVPSKFTALLDIILKIMRRGEKVIVWATFIQTIKELQKYLEKNSIKSELLIGETPVETEETKEIFTREKIIKEFHNPKSEFKVLIANPFAVAESISLHKACNNAIYLERTFNASHFMQSKDRIHRVGLDPDITTNYYYILSSNSIDETIHNRLIEKENRMLELIESQEIPLIRENMDYDVDLEDDIKAIIRDYVKRTIKA